MLVITNCGNLRADVIQITNGAESRVDVAALSERLESINRVARNAANPTQTLPSGAIDPDSVSTAANSIEPSNAASELSEAKAPALDELSLDDEDNDENRNKR